MTKSIKVVPAILTDKPDVLRTMMHLSETFTDFVQVDIMDGKFVPSHSVSWQDMEGIKSSLNWEVHLMVQKPEEYLANFQKVGAKKAVFHYEASPDPDAVIRLARKLGMGVGVAVNPETSVATILPLTDIIDSILFLSVYPGFYGANFIPEVLNKVTELRRARPDLEIGIDGGIKESNIVQIARTGVDVICVGSAIFVQPKPDESYRHLLSLAQHAGQQ